VLAGGAYEVSNVIGSVEASDGWKVIPVEGFAAGLPSVLEAELDWPVAFCWMDVSFASQWWSDGDYDLRWQCLAEMQSSTPQRPG
jgi:hypothetical protein